jgi:hypothetical protein
MFVTLKKCANFHRNRLDNGAEEFTVVERARPRVQPATLAINHGDVLAAATSGIRQPVKWSNYFHYAAPPDSSFRFSSFFTTSSSANKSRMLTA